MMKKVHIIPVLLFVCSLATHAQNANRYYPSLKNLFSEIHDKQMPADFNYYDSWIKNMTQAVFYKDLQHTVSPNGDASFQSMGLIFKRQNTFKVGNSGFELIINKDKTDFSSPINIQMEQKFRILAYLRSFDPNSYNPKNLKQKYELGLTIFNLSEEQVLADFLNKFISDKNNKKTSIQILLGDLKKEAKINVTIDEKNDKKPLTSIVTQIYKQTNKYCSAVLYDIYIKTKDPKKEGENFARFFRKFTPDNASNYIDEVVSYEATIAIPKTEISLIIPKEIIEVFAVDEKTNISTLSEDKLEVKPSKIQMKTINTDTKKCVEFTLTLAKTINPSSFKMLHEISLNNHPFLKPNQRELTLFKVADIQNLIFSISEKEIIVEMNVKTETGDWSYTIMKQACSLN